jgi:hypothetical protein
VEVEAVKPLHHHQAVLVAVVLAVEAEILIQDKLALLTLEAVVAVVVRQLAHLETAALAAPALSSSKCLTMLAQCFHRVLHLVYPHRLAALMFTQ